VYLLPEGLKRECFKFSLATEALSKIDALSKLASSSDDGKPKNIQWEALIERSIDPHEVLWLDRSSTWMDPSPRTSLMVPFLQIQKRPIE